MSALLPGKFHGRRSLEGCSPCGRWGLDTTEWLHLHFSLSCVGEGNGNPLQCFCLENPRDGGAWWAAVHGVAEGWTRLSDFTFTFHFHALEKEMATHSSTLAWQIPGMGEPGGLPSMGSHRVGHYWSNLAAAAAAAVISDLGIFYLLIGHFTSSLEKCSNPLTIFILVYLSLYCWIVRVHYSES